MRADVASDCSLPCLQHSTSFSGGDTPWSSKDSGKGCLAGAQAGGSWVLRGLRPLRRRGRGRGGSARASGSDGAESLPEAGARRWGAAISGGINPGGRVDGT